jgi:hypothetical protein
MNGVEVKESVLAVSPTGRSTGPVTVLLCVVSPLTNLGTCNLLRHFTDWPSLDC